MTDDSTIPLLDLAAIISKASLTITKSQLHSVERSTSSKPQDALNGLSDAKEVNGVNGCAKQRPSKQSSSSAPSTDDVLQAKASLVQAASDLSLLIMGPANYLKSLSYGVGDWYQRHGRLLHRSSC